MRDASVYARLWADARKREAGRDWKEPKAENDNVLWFAGPQSRTCNGDGSWRSAHSCPASLPGAQGMGLQAAPHHVGAVDMRAERRGTRSTPQGCGASTAAATQASDRATAGAALALVFRRLPPLSRRPSLPPQHFQMFMVRPEC